MKLSFKIFLIIFYALPFYNYAQQSDLIKKSASIFGKLCDEKKKGITCQIDVLDYPKCEIIEKIQSSPSGNFQISVIQNTKFILFIKHPNYLFQSILVSIPDTANYKKMLDKIILQKLEVGKTIVLNTVSFEFGKATVLHYSKTDLEAIISLMNENPKVQLEIAGHTDNFGSEVFSQELSDQRAKSLASVLIQSGIDKSRLNPIGYGNTLAIASNYTEEGRELNNRMEITVRSVKFESKKGSEKQKKAILQAPTKQYLKPNNGDNSGNSKEDIPNLKENDINADSMSAGKEEEIEEEEVGPTEPIARIDYKGNFIADEAPMAFTTVNLVNNNGEIFKTTKTDKDGKFEFTGVDPNLDVTMVIAPEETQGFDKIVLADTSGNLVSELIKVNGEFVLALLKSEKTQLGKVYMIDPPLRALRKKSRGISVFGNVIDENANPLNAKIEVVDNATNETVENIQSNNDGSFNISLFTEKDYNITFNKSSYLFQSISLNTKSFLGNDKKLDNVILKKVAVGKKIVLNNIFFDSNDFNLSKESFSELDRAVKFMNDIKSLHIEISGHTDNVGSEENNKQLSEKRAMEVANYLIKNGCDEDRIVYRGYGSMQSIGNNNTENGRKLNRRTEFKVLKMDLASEGIAKVEIKKSTLIADEKQGEEQGEEKDTSEDIKNLRNEVSNKGNVKENNSPIPKEFKKYDTDKSGDISSKEIEGAIDDFFEKNTKGEANKKAKELITNLLNYFFEQ